MDRLILLVESRIRGDVYVRFGGELPKTHRSNTAGRWMLSLLKQLIYFRYNIFINVLPAFLEMVCNKFCIFFQSDRLLIQNHSTLIKSRKTYKNFSRHMTL